MLVPKMTPKTHTHSLTWTLGIILLDVYVVSLPVSGGGGVVVVVVVVVVVIHQFSMPESSGTTEPMFVKLYRMYPRSSISIHDWEDLSHCFIMVDLYSRHLYY